MIPVISTLVICIFIIGFIPVHDPPKYLRSKNKFKSAKNSVKYYNGNSQESGIFMKELKKLQDNSIKHQIIEDDSISLKDFCKY